MQPQVSKRARKKRASATVAPEKPAAVEKASKWRLKRTLSRRLDFRPIELQDMKYVWAAYQKGALATLGERWAKPTMSVTEFDHEFKLEVVKNYSSVWVLFAQTKLGFQPVGLVLAFFSHPNPVYSPFQIIGDMVWFPWASKRNRVEAAVNFFAKIRNEHPLVEYARGACAKRFFEVMCMHGVMRRAGTTFNVFPGEAVAVFETRRS